MQQYELYGETLLQHGQFDAAAYNKKGRCDNEQNEGESYFYWFIGECTAYRSRIQVTTLLRSWYNRAFKAIRFLFMALESLLQHQLKNLKSNGYICDKT
jgi:hypothetical protein